MLLSVFRLSTNTSALAWRSDKLVGMGRQVEADTGLCVKSRSQLSNHNWLCVNGILSVGRERVTESEKRFVFEKVRPHRSHNFDIKSFIAKDKSSSSEADM